MVYFRFNLIIIYQWEIDAMITNFRVFYLESSDIPYLDFIGVNQNSTTRTKIH